VAGLTEAQIHKAVVAHLARRGVPGLVYVHPANGGFRLDTEAAILQGMGVRAGAADLLLWHDGKAFALELKAERGKVSPPQKAFLEDMANAGAHVGVAFGLDGALKMLEGWHLLRGRVQ
jgi:VRR-NUC domain